MKLSEHEHARRMELYLAGLSDTAVGKAVGSSRSGIYRWRKTHGLPVILAEPPQSLCWDCARAYASMCDFIASGKKVYARRTRRGLVTDCPHFIHDDAAGDVLRPCRWGGEISCYQAPRYGKVNL